jgi:hypothetical protein
VERPSDVERPWRPSGTPASLYPQGLPPAARASYRRYMTTPLPVARVLLVFTAVLFGLSVAEGNPVFVFHSVLTLFLAGYLVGAAVESERPSARRR